jgi:hypothetical protein
MTDPLIAETGASIERSMQLVAETKRVLDEMRDEREPRERPRLMLVLDTEDGDDGQR